MKKIALIGYGRIGQAIYQMLSQQGGYTVHPYDSQDNLTYTDPILDRTFEVAKIDPLNFHSHINEIVDLHDAVIAATPYHLNTIIASVCASNGKAYFDLTEDTHVTSYIQKLATEFQNQQGLWLMPQCGLAPGAVSIIANNLAKRFDKIKNVQIRVGALPVTANNRMKYYLTWSSEGLINEYCHPCQAIVNGEEVMLQPLDGVESITVDGTPYEAFNTSGGIGSLIQTLQGRAENVDYKTIRYEGHRDLMAFVLQDLGMQNDQKLLVDLFNKQVPHTTQDVVIIWIQVAGWRNGKYEQDTYQRKIYADDKMTAIQKTTAAGLCTAVHYWATVGEEKGLGGLIRNEIIAEGDLYRNPFWDVYR